MWPSCREDSLNELLQFQVHYLHEATTRKMDSIYSYLIRLRPLSPWYSLMCHCNSVLRLMAGCQSSLVTAASPTMEGKE